MTPDRRANLSQEMAAVVQTILVLRKGKGTGACLDMTGDFEKQLQIRLMDLRRALGYL